MSTSLKSWWSSSPVSNRRLVRLQGIKSPLRPDLQVRSPRMQSMLNTCSHSKCYGKTRSLRSTLLRRTRLQNSITTRSRVLSTYQRLLRCLNWIALCTGPDIAWATSRAASLITHDPDTCFIRIKHICQYLHHTLGYALRCVPIPPQSKHKLWVLGDASFAPTGEKSQQGLIIVYHGITSHQRKGGNLVQWRSSRQDLIAKSTCEAELIASSEALQQGENIAIVVAEDDQ